MHAHDHGQGRPDRDRWPLAGAGNLNSGFGQAGCRRISALGDPRRAGDLRRRLHHRFRRPPPRPSPKGGGRAWRRWGPTPARGTRPAGAAVDRVQPEGQARAKLCAPAVQQPGGKPDAPRAAPAGGPVGGHGRPARIRPAEDGEPRSLAGDLEGQDQAGRGSPGVAGDGGCRLLLPSCIGALILFVQHVDVRPGLLAELPLLPRPRDVGYRELRLSHPAPDRPRGGPGAARLSLSAAARRPAQRRHLRLPRAAVPLGKRPAPRRGGDPTLRSSPGVRATRQPERGPRIRPVRACNR